MAYNEENIDPRDASSSMSTKELARSLGLLTKLSSSKSKKSKKKKQPFQYLVVIDFESTCWKDKRVAYAPEVIEFPAVLVNTSSGLIESEFHHYVQPNEHPRLSDFCKELTGITQAQVDSGIPIGTCLMLFKKWLKEISEEKNIHFLCDVKPDNSQSNKEHSSAKWCTFVTWSDWDIGICLKKECERKRHILPPPLRAWIDLRISYKTFYSRKPNGVAGALKDLGIQFAGRQHSGLIDARNEARLTWRMIQDGCVMNVTSSIDTNVELLHEIIRNGFKKITPVNNVEGTDSSNDNKTNKQTSSTSTITYLSNEVLQSEPGMMKTSSTLIGANTYTADSTSEQNKNNKIQNHNQIVLKSSKTDAKSVSKVEVNAKPCHEKGPGSMSVHSLISPPVSIVGDFQERHGTNVLIKPLTVLHTMNSKLTHTSTGIGQTVQQESRTWSNQRKSVSKIKQTLLKTGLGQQTSGIASPLNVSCPSKTYCNSPSSVHSELKRPGKNAAVVDNVKIVRLENNSNLTTRTGVKSEGKNSEC